MLLLFIKVAAKQTSSFDLWWLFVAQMRKANIAEKAQSTNDFINHGKSSISTNTSRRIYKCNKEITWIWNVAIALAQTNFKCTLFLMSFPKVQYAQLGGISFKNDYTNVLEPPFLFSVSSIVKICYRYISYEKMLNLDHLSIQLITKKTFSRCTMMPSFTI